jgi:hypothetical protein
VRFTKIATFVALEDAALYDALVLELIDPRVTPLGERTTRDARSDMRRAPLAASGQPRQDLELVETEALGAGQFLVQPAENPGI